MHPSPSFNASIFWEVYLLKYLTVALLCILASYPPTPAKAQEFESLFLEFDASSLTRSEKRFLQTALAFEGHYNGLLDGAWGKLSREALSKYSRSKFGTDSANWHMAMLAHSFFNFIERDGWEYFYIEPAGVSILWPFGSVISDGPSDGFVNYRHGNSSLGISVAVQDRQSAQNSHDYVQSRHELAGTAYSLRKDNLAISSSKTLDGATLYGRSDFVNRAWSTVLLSVQMQDEALLTTMAASIRVGKAPSLQISQNGKLEQAIFKTAELLDQAEKDQQDSTQPTSLPKIREPKTDPQVASSGSGFFVTTDGVVMTNAHVVDGCDTLFVDKRPATILASSGEFDLALLTVEGPKPKEVAVFSASSANLNADVTAVGFPYSGLLGGLNVTRGSVSALKVLTGDLTTMQITAPIQQGNSGGPVLASDGEVVGVVVSKLNATKVAEVMGDVPQNVNFAIRGEIARLFMAQNGIEPLLSLDNDKMEPEALAKKAANFTTFIQCN